MSTGAGPAEGSGRLSSAPAVAEDARLQGVAAGAGTPVGEVR